MKKIDTSTIVSGSSYPPSKKGFNFLQESYQEILSALAQGMAGQPITGGSYVLYGCVETNLGAGNYSYSEGYIYNSASREVYYFPYVASIAIPTAPILNVLVTPDPTADPTTFTDGSIQNVHDNRTLVVSNGTLGSGDINYDDLIFLSTEYIAHDAFSGYRKDGRSVHLYGRVGASGSPMGSSGSSFTLPVAFRPKTTQTILGVLWGDTGTDMSTGTLTINTNGTVWHSALTGAGTARWATITGCSYNL